MTSTTSSTYLNQTDGRMSNGAVCRALYSKSSQYVLHAPGLIGLPMGKPGDCWDNLSLNVKIVVFTTNFSRSMMSSGSNANTVVFQKSSGGLCLSSMWYLPWPLPNFLISN